MLMRDWTFWRVIPVSVLTMAAGSVMVTEKVGLLRVRPTSRYSLMVPLLNIW